MAACHWTADFCLGCDTQTDGAAYCSEACRLLEFEKTSTSSSTATSPSSSAPSSPSIFATPSYPWSSQPRALTYASSPVAVSPIHRFAPASNSLEFRHRAISSNHDSAFQFSGDHPISLTPSSSHSSLCSIQTTTSASSVRAPTSGPDSIVISDRATTELRKYAMSMEYVKLQRRRSY